MLRPHVAERVMPVLAVAEVSARELAEAEAAASAVAEAVGVAAAAVAGAPTWL
jgi:hypothetical protein